MSNQPAALITLMQPVERRMSPADVRGRIHSPAQQLRFGETILRPGRPVSVLASNLAPHIDALCDFMSKKRITAHWGGRELDVNELRKVVVGVPLDEAPKVDLSTLDASKLKGESAEAEEPSAPPAEDPPVAASAEDTASSESAPAAEEAAPEIPAATPAETTVPSTPSSKKKGRG